LGGELIAEAIADAFLDTVSGVSCERSWHFVGLEDATRSPPGLELLSDDGGALQWSVSDRAKSSGIGGRCDTRVGAVLLNTTRGVTRLSSTGIRTWTNADPTRASCGTEAGLVATFNDGDVAGEPVDVRFGRARLRSGGC